MTEDRWPGGKRQALYRQAIEAWGTGAQLLMVVEEMAELSKAILKLGREGQKARSLVSIMDEAADVEIMLEQLREILWLWSRENESGVNMARVVDHFKAHKLDRLAVRLKQEAGAP